MNKIEGALNRLEIHIEHSEFHPIRIDEDNNTLSDARAELTELKELLRKMEWNAPLFATLWTCPVCSNNREQGHKPDCRLAKLIKEAPNE